MSAPSTTGYRPLDSGAPEVFSEDEMNNYVGAAFLAWLICDHFLTLDREVEWIWTLRWRLPKVIFFINRYFSAPLLLVFGIPDYIFPVRQSFCNVSVIIGFCQPILMFATAELLIIVRVCSLYGHRKLAVWALGSCFVLALVSAIVTQTVFGRHAYRGVYYQFLPGCLITLGSTDPPVWVSFIVMEGILLLLTAYKLFSFRKQMNQTVAVLTRDSIVYAVACLSLLLVYVVDRYLTVNVQTPVLCISSIAVGRMMMNIRGLILDDPDHTVHLQTMQFGGQTNLNTVSEEADC